MTGYGVIDQRGSELFFVACGVIRTTPEKSFLERLQELHSGLGEVIATHRPEHAAVEEIFTAVNPRSALKLGHARGVLILALMQANLPVAEFTPMVVKQAVAGYGKAPKEQVQQMVRSLLHLSANPSQDAADALAVAICLANHAGVAARLRKP